MSTLIRWEPFRELTTLQNELGRLFGNSSEAGARAAKSWVPALDVWETDKEVVYAFDLPGIPEDKITIEVHDETLTVSAVREEITDEQSERYHRYERRHGAFSRAVGLPQGVDESKITASVANGVLEVRVPKPEEQKPRRITLGSSHADVEAESASQTA